MANQFCRQFVSSVIGAGATGKSALRYLQYLSLAIGRSLTGEKVFLQCRVLILSFEDDKDELRRRMRAAMLRYGLSHEEVKGWVFCYTPKGIKFAEIQRGTRQAGLLDKALRAAIKRFRPDLLALDPFIKTHSLEENDNNAMDYVADAMATIAIEFNLAVDTPHHAKKGMMIAGNADAGRGASAARDAFRLVNTLATMSEDEAKLFEISDVDRRAYIRLDPAKVNIATSAIEAKWFKLVGVPLNNGNETYPSGDTVQTVEPWDPPDTWANLSTVALNAALTELDEGMSNGRRFSSASNARSRAAWPILKKHCKDKSEAQCRQIIKTWVATGLLFNVPYHDPVERKDVDGVKVDNSKRPA
jgi:AAA domain